MLPQGVEPYVIGYKPIPQNTVEDKQQEKKTEVGFEPTIPTGQVNFLKSNCCLCLLQDT